jgi:hypothetical protein
MLKTLLYSHSEQLYGFEFLKDDLSEAGEVIFVTPSPVIADIYRDKLATCDFKKKSVEVLTISKFMSNSFESFNDEAVQIEQKVNLLMTLGVGWKKFFPDQSYEKFLRSYNLLTDLRSFTLDPVILETALEEYDETIKMAVKVFYAIMESQELVDEHKAYFLLSDYLRLEREVPEDKKIVIFLGFNFFSGAQVDFLKSLAIRDDVYIPIAQEVYDGSIQTDWVQWLEDSGTQKLALTKERPENRSLKVCRFSKKHLSEAIKHNIGEIESAKIFLGTRNSNPSDYMEISLNNTQFKCSIDLLSEDVDHFRSYFERTLFIGKKDEISYEEFFEKFESYFSELINNKSKILDKNLKLYKLKSLILNFIKSWRELSETNITFSEFDFHLLIDNLALSAPRNSFVTLSEDPKYKIYDVNGLDQYDPNGINIITAKSDYNGLKSSRAKNSLEVEKILSSVGPLRRSEFEFTILRNKIKELLGLKSTILFLEEDFEKHDLSWNSILEDFELVDITKNIKKEISPTTYNFLKSNKSYQHTFLSPTRLQSYIDCPKSFYFKYVEKIMPRVELEETLQLSDLGTLEHLVLEKYFEAYAEYSFENVVEISKRLFDEFLKDSNKQVLSADYNVFLSEIQNFSNNGIKALYGLKDKFQKLELEFEVELKESNTDKRRQGRVDLLANSTEACVLIDFKRSGGSIPGRPQLLRLEKVQVWFYLNLLKDLALWSPDKSFVIGYLNLSKHDGSVLITNDESYIEKIGEIEEFKGSKIHYFDDKWQEAFDNYHSYENDTFNKMINEKEFKVSPREDSVCRFCSIGNVCPKMQVNL